MRRRSFLLGATVAGLSGMPTSGFANVRVRRFYINSRFGQLHGYRAEPEDGGTKTPLICIHQTPSSAKIFSEFIAIMGEDRIAIAFDNPGYGASDGPYGRVTIEAYAETMAAALEDMGFGPGGSGPVDVLGMLTGAMIGGELARSRPDLVRRLVLVQSLVMQKEQRLALKAELEGVVREGWATQGTDFYITRLNDALSSLDPEQTPEQAVADFADSLVAGEDYLKAGMTALTYPTETRIRDISQRTLVIVLGDERAEDATGAADIIPNAQLLRLLNYSRHTFRANPDAMAAPVRTFLDSPSSEQ